MVIHLRFGILEPPTIPIMARGGTEPDNRNNVENQNRFAPLRQHGNETGDHINEALISGILRGRLASAASISRWSKGRDPIPLTPKILLFSDHLESDKGKILPHARSKSYIHNLKGNVTGRSSGNMRQRRQQLIGQQPSKWMHTRWLW